MSLPYRRTGLATFNDRAAEELEPTLLACCRSRTWAAEVLAGRPYGSVGEVVAAGDRALKGLSEEDIDEVLATHARIGEPAENDQSRREQAALGADNDVLAALEDGNRAYEERFGHVYLVCATGKSAEEVLAQLHERLANDPATERAVLRHELAEINAVRLERLLS